MKDTLKKFLGNKNTVTIIGVVLCMILLYVFYNVRINQKVALVRIPYANQTIQPKTEITSDMISYMEVAGAFLTKASYLKSADDIVGRYSGYNTVIAEGSPFYSDLVIDKKDLPDASFIDVPKDYTVINYKVDMDSTYANSMMPNDYINIYFKGVGDDGNVMFGKFLSNVKILDVKDGSGQHVFENSDEARTPAYMLFALPEDMHLLFRKALYLEGQYGVELILIPDTQDTIKKDSETISSADIQSFIDSKTKMVSVNEILSSTKSKVDGSDTTTNTTTTTTDTTTKKNNTKTTTNNR